MPSLACFLLASSVGLSGGAKTKEDQDMMAVDKYHNVCHLFSVRKGERVREREIHIPIYIYICTHTFTYTRICVFICIYMERERAPLYQLVSR